jgi:hypothetical protein
VKHLHKSLFIGFKLKKLELAELEPGLPRHVTRLGSAGGSKAGGCH